MLTRQSAWATVLLSTAACGLFAQTNADVEKGRQLFLGMCSRCHGATGGGGEGPSLTRLTRAHNDEELRAIIRAGIADRGMPRVRRFTDTELMQIAGFVHSLGQAAGTAAAGKPEIGRAVYQKLGCSSCHTIAGEGGDFGPELTGIGVRRAPDYLRQAILDPGAALPRGDAIPGRGLSEFLPVRAVMQDGRQISGVRANEDSFTIQIRDAAGKLYSLRKPDIRQLDKQFGKSVMPDYKAKATASEVEDLVAYLSGLGAGQQEEAK
jgi:putative heme-binding domain-containing protein